MENAQKPENNENAEKTDAPSQDSKMETESSTPAPAPASADDGANPPEAKAAKTKEEAGPSTSKEGRKSRSPSRRKRPEKREFRQVMVTNVPFEMKWQDLKDLFNKEVGGVNYCSINMDDKGKSKGTAVLEFDSSERVETAVRKMHRFPINDRKIVVKKDFDAARSASASNKPSGPAPNRGAPRRRSPSPRRSRRRSEERDGDRRGMDRDFGDTYGLSREFLRKLGIGPPLVNRVYVSNLAWNVEHDKIRETFKIAGNIRWLSVIRDKYGKSKGRCIVEYDHPVEAVQAISLLHNQIYHDRKLSVHLDQKPMLTPKLPEGLPAVGNGLGPNGTPLLDIANNYRAMSEAKKLAGLSALGAVGGAGSYSNIPFGASYGGSQLGALAAGGALPAQALGNSSALGALSLQNILETVKKLNAGLRGAGGL